MKTASLATSRATLNAAAPNNALDGTLPIPLLCVAAMAHYIDNFYNVERRHSYLGNINPTEFGTLWTSTYSIPQLA